ncbi:ABC transporter substrate-binding protein [Candidatus Epulonipiscium viviparus]|uniref:ABC transporter substrate-binding protein n=1 Tax=Candidatus Epulonipiscium viviparus TaxID=420336 RepID=UPI00049683F2|nr:ABC transporter substrate-binding protein [Candidatus Epulopiscium viviparus]
MKKVKALLISMMMILSGCAASDDRDDVVVLENTQFKLESTGAINKEKVLTTLIDIQPPPAFNGNPYDAAGINWSIQPLVYDYLCEFSPFPERMFKTSLLESFKLDGTHLTMTLKEDLKWSDGSPLTAADVMTNYYLNVGRSAFWTYATELKKIDDRTIEVDYVTESPLLLNITFALPIMSPASVYGEYAEAYKDIALNYRELNPETGNYKFTAEGAALLADANNKMLAYKPNIRDVIASGPYIMTNATTAEVIFEENPHYRVDVAIDKIRGLRPGSAEAFATSILEGQYTIENGGLSPDMSRQVDKRFRDTLRKIYVPEISQIGYVFNEAKYPVNIPEVRKAISMATNRDILIQISEPGSFLSDQYNTGLTPSMIETYADPQFLSTLTDYSYNPAAAEAMLTSIGWSRDDKGKWINEKGEHVEIEIATINSWPTFMLTAEAMSTMLSEFGFKIKYAPMESGTVWTYLNGPNHTIGGVFLGGAGTYAHPWEAFSNILNSPRIGLPEVPKGEDRIIFSPTTEKEYNVTKMLKELFAAMTPEETQAITHEFMQLNNELCLFMPLVEKAAPLRVYDVTLSLPEAVPNEVQKSFYYFGPLNLMIAKMLRGGEIFFVE